jgi:hypothetical protein
MGIACSPNTFQEKMSNLMATLGFIQTYLDDLLIITKGSLEDHLEKLRVVLIRLQDAGLKIKSFGGKAANGKKRHGSGKKESSNSFVQVMERFSKLKKELKKSQKCAHKRKRRYKSRDTSDSDSE